MVRVIEFVNVRTHYSGVGFINMYVRFDFTSKSIYNTYQMQQPTPVPNKYQGWIQWLDF